jgi:hypothetical protein
MQESRSDLERPNQTRTAQFKKRIQAAVANTKISKHNRNAHTTKTASNDEPSSAGAKDHTSPRKRRIVGEK